MIESFRVQHHEITPHCISLVLMLRDVASALLAIVLPEFLPSRATAPTQRRPRPRINPAVVLCLRCPELRLAFGCRAPATFTPASGKPTLLVFFYTLACIACCRCNRLTPSPLVSQPVHVDSPSELPNLPSYDAAPWTTRCCSMLMAGSPTGLPIIPRTGATGAASCAQSGRVPRALHAEDLRERWRRTGTGVDEST